MVWYYIEIFHQVDVHIVSTPIEEFRSTFLEFIAKGNGNDECCLVEFTIGKNKFVLVYGDISEHEFWPTFYKKIKYTNLKIDYFEQSEESGKKNGKKYKNDKNTSWYIVSPPSEEPRVMKVSTPIEVARKIFLERDCENCWTQFEIDGNIICAYLPRISWHPYRKFFSKLICTEVKFDVYEVPNWYDDEDGDEDEDDEDDEGEEDA